MYKGRLLVKLMIVVIISGYYFFVFGLYVVKNNDVVILSYIMKINKEDVLKWIEERDVFVVDRGFWDFLILFEDFGLVFVMFVFMKKGEK